MHLSYKGRAYIPWKRPRILACTYYKTTELIRAVGLSLGSEPGQMMGPLDPYQPWIGVGHLFGLGHCLLTGDLLLLLRDPVEFFLYLTGNIGLRSDLEFGVDLFGNWGNFEIFLWDSSYEQSLAMDACLPRMYPRFTTP